MKISVISGGSASNELVPLFNHLSHDLCYILPVSDNGGSTAELIRVLGGPAVGDIRSRLTRLIPEENAESVALKKLMSHRLPSNAAQLLTEWLSIVDGSHKIWNQIDASCKELVRSFLIHVHMELLKRSRRHSRNFKFELASVGNLFLTGARLFCGSLDSGIELFLRLNRVPAGVQVLPCLNTNFTYHISALLQNDNIITGQSQISHPTLAEEDDKLQHSIQSLPSELGTVKTSEGASGGSSVMLNSLINLSNSSINDDLLINRFDQLLELEDELMTPSYIHPDLKKSHLHFSKDDLIPLPSPVQRIFYISPYGEEIYPMAHSRVLKLLLESKLIVYSIGSLMTSTVPVLILQGVGSAILSKPAKKKVLLLNGCNDRETGNLTASGYIRFIVKSIEYSRKLERVANEEDTPEVDSLDWSLYVSHLVHLKSPTNIELDFDILRKKGIKCVEVDNVELHLDHYDLEDLELKLKLIV